jgi:hypothetical protein
MIYFIYIQDNYTIIKNKENKYCAAKPFLMAKLILLQTTTFRDLKDNITTHDSLNSFQTIHILNINVFTIIINEK